MIKKDLAQWASDAEVGTKIRTSARNVRTAARSVRTATGTVLVKAQATRANARSFAANRIPPLPRPVLAVARFLVDHLLFMAALAGGIAVRVVTARGYPGVLWFTGDSNWYLGKTLRPDASASKSLGYPFFLQKLEPFHSFELVSGLQHLMGLSLAVMVYVLLRRAGLAGWLSTLLTLPLLLDAFQIQLEHLLMAESLFTFLIGLAVTMLLWRRRPPWWIALVAGLLLGYAVLVRTAGAALLPVLFICLVVRWAGWRALTALTIGAAIPVLTYMQWFYSAHGVHALTTSDGMFLWGRTSSFADCSKVQPPPQERMLCMDGVPPSKRLAPGTLIWRKEAPVRHVKGSPISNENNAFLRDYAIRVIKAQPGDYAHTIVHDFGKAVGGKRFRHPNPRTEALYHFTGKRRYFMSHVYIAGGTALGDAITYGGRPDPGRVVQPYAKQMVTYQRYAFLPGPVLGLILILGTAGVIFARGRRREVFLAWSVTGTLLIGPIATADFDYRYVLPAVPFAVLAAGLALAPRPERPKRTPPAAEREQDRESARPDDTITSAPAPAPAPVGSTDTAGTAGTANMPDTTGSAADTPDGSAKDFSYGPSGEPPGAAVNGRSPGETGDSARVITTGPQDFGT